MARSSRTTCTLVALTLAPLFGCAVDSPVMGLDASAPLSAARISNAAEVRSENGKKLIACESNARSASGVATIGPEGGRLRMGAHELVIPAGALARSTEIGGEVVGGAGLAVRFSPHGLQFSRPAVLTLNYAGCAAAQRQAVSVVYVDDATSAVLETPPSADNKRAQVVRAAIAHFSVYALAD